MEKSAEAMKRFAELWGSGNLDCGPEDYEFMAERCIEALVVFSMLFWRSKS